MYVLQIVVCPFVLFLLAIVLSVLLRYTDFDCPFGIFKFFLTDTMFFVKCYRFTIQINFNYMYISPNNLNFLFTGTLFNSSTLKDDLFIF